VDPLSQPTQPAPPASFRFTEKEKYEVGFEKFYEERIRPKVRELESMRTEKKEEIKKLEPKAKMIFWGCIIAGIAGTFLTRNIAPLVIGGMVGWFTKWIMLGGPKSEYEAAFKTKIMPEVLKFFGDYEYQDTKPLSEDTLKKSTLFTAFNRARFQDTISGKYRGKNMQFTEADLTYSSGKSSSSVFHGKIIILELPRTITGKIIIKPESKKGLMNKFTNKEAGLPKVAIPDSHFEEIFEVYSNDSNAAASLITPDFTQKLIQLNDQYPGNYIRCCFMENYVMLAMAINVQKPGSNMFEMTTMETPIVEDLHKFLSEFHTILGILDTLDLVKEI